MDWRDAGCTQQIPDVQPAGDSTQSAYPPTALADIIGSRQPPAQAHQLRSCGGTDGVGVRARQHQFCVQVSVAFIPSALMTTWQQRGPLYLLSKTSCSQESPDFIVSRWGS